ncbi:MAG: tetratricopeptide repeat protein, partial [Desulfobulbaceae bacterium]|nr:tetratricopeptide repeat protein [Desulfobulbaceae bacterium]
SKLAAQVEASVLYESLTVHVEDGDLDDAESVADDLATNYANTAYAAQSNLAMAKLYMDKNRDQDAADVLNKLLAMRGNQSLRQIGRLRLARILLYQDKAQEVVDLLADQDDEAFAALFAEVRGDAFAALGQIAAAGDEYRFALADTSQIINRSIVQMKLVDLPDAPDPEPVVVDSEESEEPAEAAVEDEGGESE